MGEKKEECRKYIEKDGIIQSIIYAEGGKKKE